MQNFLINSKNVQVLTITFLILLKVFSVLCECTNSEWLCDDAITCIDAFDRCDGTVDCPDGSDENTINCYQVTTCPDYSFQCNYGGCITGNLRCNGKADCIDKSDEFFCNRLSIMKLKNLQGTCKSSDDMQCASMTECINIDDVCDGIADCADGSDETIPICGMEVCSSESQFRCAYGACVSGFARCNGTKECVDGSDEAIALCGYKRQFANVTTKPKMPANLTTPTPTPTPTTTTTTARTISIPAISTSNALPCKVPEALDTVAITSVKNDEPIMPNTLVPDDESIRAKCKNSKNNEVNDLYCLNGKWDGKFPQCGGFCEATSLNGISTSPVCVYKSTHSNFYCQYPILANVSIIIYCGIGYTHDRSQNQQLICQHSGDFTEERLPCQQQCGQVVPNGHSLTKNGYPIKPSIAPWHASIYRNDGGVQKNICGGSIISPRLIITAAHCFWNISTPLPPVLYRIKAGKVLSQYNDIKDKEGSPQESEVEMIYMSDQYEDRLKNFRADVAILKLKSPLRYTQNISAICYDGPLGDSRDFVRSDISGTVTGYGRTGVLEQIGFETLNYDECSILEDGSDLANDKFCLRNDNSNSTLCMGDSGGGFVVQRPNGFHLLGVVSYTPFTRLGCVTAKFIGMSNVAYIRNDLYINWQKELKNDQKLF